MYDTAGATAGLRKELGISPDWSQSYPQFSCGAQKISQNEVKLSN